MALNQAIEQNRHREVVKVARIAAHYGAMAFGMREDGFDEEAVESIAARARVYAARVKK